ncbi:DUF3114 domain-containing protein [Enterococcus sp. LJL128]
MAVIDLDTMCRQVEERYQLYKPIKMTEAAYASYLFRLVELERKIIEQDGWDEPALRACIFWLKKKVEEVPEEAEALIQQLELEARQIGTVGYSRLFYGSQKGNREKVRLLLRQLGSRMDEHNQLQLYGTHRISLSIAPHSQFLEELAACVKRGYPSGLLVDADEGTSKREIQMVHQLRHYIDRQNLFYIRANYTGETDYDKLLSYARLERQKLIYRDTARFHNRMSRSQVAAVSKKYKKKQVAKQANAKVKTANGLSEFIIHVETGEFISQWNQLRTQDGLPVFIEQAGAVTGIRHQLIDSSVSSYDLKGRSGKEIADTESFNYDSGFLDWLPWRRRHERYDMKPGGQEKLDSDIRKRAKKEWPFPKRYREIYWSEKSIFRQIKKS